MKEEYNLDHIADNNLLCRDSTCSDSTCSRQGHVQVKVSVQSAKKLQGMMKKNFSQQLYHFGVVSVVVEEILQIQMDDDMD